VECGQQCLVLSGPSWSCVEGRSKKIEALPSHPRRWGRGAGEPPQGVLHATLPPLSLFRFSEHLKHKTLVLTLVSILSVRQVCTRHLPPRRLHRTCSERWSDVSVGPPIINDLNSQQLAYPHASDNAACYQSAAAVVPHHALHARQLRPLLPGQVRPF